MKFWFAVVLVLGLSAAKRERLNLKTPEVEVQLALTELDNLRRALESSEKLFNSRSLGPKNIAAGHAFANAKRLFDQAEFLAAARELDDYFNLTQVHDPKQYMKALYIYGRCNEALGLDAKTIKSYLRYIAAFVTAAEPRSYSRLIDVMKRLIPVAAKQSPQGKKQMRKLFSSLLSQNLPIEKKSELFYYAANNARKSGDSANADEWFEGAAANAPDKGLRGRSVYFRVLLALADEKVDLAEKLLKENIGKVQGELDDLYRLTMARIASQKGRADTAAEYYSQIGSRSPSYREALFESAFIDIALAKEQSARNKALKYLMKYPDGAQALQLKSLLAYLDLRAGDLGSAGKRLSESSDKLGEISNWMSNNYHDLDRIDQAQTNALHTKTSGYLRQSPLLVEGVKLFGMLAEQRRRLTDQRGKISQLIYVLAKSNIKQFRPAWIQRSRQLGDASEKTLAVGHRLLAAIRQMLAKKLSEVEVAALESSENRRRSLLSHNASIKRRHDSWAAWANLVGLSFDLKERNDQLAKLRADIAATSHLKTKRDENLEQRLARLEGLVGRGLELVRSQRIRAVIDQSSHRLSLKLHMRYANLIHEEQQTLLKHLDKMEKAKTRFLADDVRAAFKKWEFVSKLSYEGLRSFDLDTQGDTNDLLKRFDSLIKKHDALDDRIILIEEKLERTLGKSLNRLVAHYNSEIKAQKSRQDKWGADIQQLNTDKTGDQKQKLVRKFELEQQMLRNKLADLREGVTTRWED